MATWGAVSKTLGILGVGGAGLILALENSLKNAGEYEMHPPKLKWPHTGLLASLDHASVRRGYEVYKGVCAACHPMQYVYYRNLVNVTHSEAEAKAEAAEAMIPDGPNDEGQMFERPGVLADGVPKPYENDVLGELANNGALPPDLSMMAFARHGGEDYIFSLLTGYTDPPPGVPEREGLYYNPYFVGQFIAMAPPLYNEVIEYADGTPATRSQMAKDVSTFLLWSADRHHDERKQLRLKTFIVIVILLPFIAYWKRRAWAPMMNRKIIYKRPKYSN